MITIEEIDNLINVAVFGEFTIADYKEFEEHVLHRIKFQGKVNILLDLRDMLKYTLDVAWEEIKFGREHSRDFEKIAVVTTDQWIVWSAWLSRLFVDTEIRVYSDYEEAREWAIPTE